jgi:hypothetical protein
VVIVDNYIQSTLGDNLRSPLGVRLELPQLRLLGAGSFLFDRSELLSGEAFIRLLRSLVGLSEREHYRLSCGTGLHARCLTPRVLWKSSAVQQLVGVFRFPSQNSGLYQRLEVDGSP